MSPLDAIENVNDLEVRERIEPQEDLAVEARVELDHAGFPRPVVVHRLFASAPYRSYRFQSERRRHRQGLRAASSPIQGTHEDALAGLGTLFLGFLVP